MFYEMRVKEIADRVIAVLQGQNHITKDHVDTMIDHHAQGSIHYKSSSSRKEFLKDISKEVMKEIKLSPKKKPIRAKNNEEFLRDVSWLIQDAVGNAFPDGDPFDAISEQIDGLAAKHDYDTNGYFVSDIDDTPLIDILDVAAKKWLGVKDYNAYNAQMWDSVHGDATSDYDTYQGMSAKDKARSGEPYGLFGDNPHDARNPWRESLGEAMEAYDNNVQLAIADIGQIPEDEAKELATSMSLDDYLNFIIAVDKKDDPVARNILNHYLGGLPLAYESVAQEMHYMIRNKEAYVVSPDFKKLNEMDQRKVLAEMTPEGMKKILANLRGYEHPGSYESSVFSVQMNEDIIRLVKNTKIDTILEISGTAPGAAAQAAAYGGGDSAGSTTGATAKKKARFQNDKGEEEEGEVVSQDSRSTTIRTKAGTKKMNNDEVFVSEAILADIVRLSGIKK